MLARAALSRAPLRNPNTLRRFGTDRTPLSVPAGPIALVFDTETTGLVHLDASPDDPRQPDLVQLGTILVDTSNWARRSHSNLLVKLGERSVMEEKAQETHGIAPEDCDRFGVPLPAAASLFREMVAVADVVVAHNLDFDRAVMETALHRAGIGSGARTVFPQSVCTKLASTDVLRLPGKFGKFRWPTLSEAYGHFSGGKDLAKAHDALSDAEACLEVFRGLVDRGIVSLQEAEARAAARRETSSFGLEHTTPFDAVSPTEVDFSSIEPSRCDLRLKLERGRVWVSGNTYPHRERLKSLGGFWYPLSKSWAFEMGNLSRVKEYVRSTPSHQSR